MSKRLKILSPADIIQYYEAPVFTSDEYDYYFKLDIHEVGFVSSKASFILLLGYFKAKQQLFKLWEIKNISSCLEFVRVKYFPHYHRLIDLHICRPTRRVIEYRVLQLFGYQRCAEETIGRLNDFANSIVTIDSCPIFMFKEIVHFLQKHRIILPGYTRLQELIGGAISREEKRLSALIKANISAENQEQLNGFLEINQTLHELTYLKKEPKHFGAKQISSEIQKLQQLGGTLENGNYPPIWI